VAHAAGSTTDAAARVRQSATGLASVAAQLETLVGRVKHRSEVLAPPGWPGEGSRSAPAPQAAQALRLASLTAGPGWEPTEAGFDPGPGWEPEEAGFDPTGSR
jgi:hypothetical protein